jgi:hypothetical protein
VEADHGSTSDDRPPSSLMNCRAFLDYRPVVGVRHPHSQLLAWQRHPSFGHPQEQVAQSHVPQQVVFAAVSLGALFRLDIVFSFFPSALMRFQRG